MDKIKCQVCDESTEIKLSECKFCGKDFCFNHLTPENHKCKGLEKWRKIKLGETVKAGKKTIVYFHDPDSPIGGYYPKIPSIWIIKTESDADETAKKHMEQTLGKKLKFFKITKTELFFEQGIWKVLGTIEVSSLFFRTKQENFELQIDAKRGIVI